MAGWLTPSWVPAAVECTPLKRALEAAYATLLPKAAKPFVFLVRAFGWPALLRTTRSIVWQCRAVSCPYWQHNWQDCCLVRHSHAPNACLCLQS